MLIGPVRLIPKIEYLMVPKGTKFMGLGKFGLDRLIDEQLGTVHKHL